MASIKILGGDYTPQKAKLTGKSKADLTLNIDGTDYLVADYILATKHGDVREKKSLMGAALRAGSWSSSVGVNTFSVMQGVAEGMDKKMVQFDAYLSSLELIKETINPPKSFSAECDTATYKKIAVACMGWSDSQLKNYYEVIDRLQRKMKDAPRVTLETRENIKKIESELIPLRKEAEDGATFDEREAASSKLAQKEEELRYAQYEESVLEREIWRRDNAEKQKLESEAQAKEAEEQKEKAAVEKVAAKEAKAEEKANAKLSKVGAKAEKKQAKLDAKAEKKQAKLDAKLAKKQAKLDRKAEKKAAKSS